MYYVGLRRREGEDTGYVRTWTHFVPLFPRTRGEFGN